MKKEVISSRASPQMLYLNTSTPALLTNQARKTSNSPITRLNKIKFSDLTTTFTPG